MCALLLLWFSSQPVTLVCRCSYAGDDSYVMTVTEWSAHQFQRREHVLKFMKYGRKHPKVLRVSCPPFNYPTSVEVESFTCMYWWIHVVGFHSLKEQMIPELLWLRIFNWWLAGLRVPSSKASGIISGRGGSVSLTALCELLPPPPFACAYQYPPRLVKPQCPHQGWIFWCSQWLLISRESEM